MRSSGDGRLGLSARDVVGFARAVRLRGAAPLRRARAGAGSPRTDQRGAPLAVAVAVRLAVVCLARAVRLRGAAPLRRARAGEGSPRTDQRGAPLAVAVA